MIRSLSSGTLFSLALPLLLMAQPQGTAQLTGRIIDAETGEPLTGTHLFIANSMIGTATDADGRFRLRNVPPGAHQVYASMIGYELASQNLLTHADTTYHLTFALKTAVVEAGAITVVAEKDRRWKKRLRKFERLFLGESENAAEVTILNPEVLDFEAKWWGKFVARASAPLEIENRALGYHVTYYLKEFSAAGGTIKYDGEPVFRELTPNSPMQAARWQANRHRAYYGSFRHFMLTALANRAEAEAFDLYRRPSMERMQHENYRFPVEPNGFVEPGPTPTARTLAFNGVIEVLYHEESEDEAFLRWQGWTTSRPHRYQRSWIELTNGPTVVDHTGTVLDPYGVTVYGYFAYERIADDLPKEYRPE